MLEEAISAMYVGTQRDTMPVKKPVTNRPKLSVQASVAMKMHNQPQWNPREHNVKENLRPIFWQE